jgi:hypothetical protein
MRRPLLLLGAAALLALGAAPARADEGFGLKDIDIVFTDAEGSPSMEAGSHPFAMTTTLDVNTTVDPKLGEIPIDSARDVIVELPAGMAGTPTSVPRCSAAEFLSLIEDEATGSNRPACPDSSAVGAGTVRGSDETGFTEVPTAVYNLFPPPGAAAKFGLIILGVPVTLEVGVNPDPPYNVVSRSTSISQAVRFHGITVDLWGVPAAAAHDADRGFCAYNKEPVCPIAIPQKPFLTLPRSCQGPLVTIFRTRSWQSPAAWLTYPVQSHDDSEPPQPMGPIGCGALDFAANISAKPTTDQAESPSGLDFNLDIDDEGLTSPSGRAQSDIKKTVVTLPEGVTANPSVAAGLLTCSPAQFAAERVDSQPGEGCPQASKLGTVEVETPLLEGEILKGQLFVATQDDPTTSQPGAENPFDSLLALYIVIKSPKLGILVKLAGRVAPDPKTGQLVTSFGEPPYEIPQFPFSHFRFHFREGGRSPLITPPGCDSNPATPQRDPYLTTALFTPWANPANTITTSAAFEITKGVGGGPCPPAGQPPFEPGLGAGTLNNNAKSYSPFLMRLTRRDGDQDLTRFDAALPPGLTAKLAGVSQCPDAAIAVAKAKTGHQELASPSCPDSSKVGSVIGGAGVGSQLTYVSGSIYLAGPIGGAPASVVGVVPAVAGPFDVGTVVVRQALRLDPRTGKAWIDGALSDPLPHILAGIPLKVRDIRVNVDRPDFTLNPTNCAPMAIWASIWGGGADVFSSLDDAPVSLAQRFQAVNCSRLGFKPRLGLHLRGGTRRGAHPALTAILRPRPGDANISSASATLPRSEFLDQGHIRTICTRVQFAADICPKAAIYGQAIATSPLVDFPILGPVYLRSSNNKLPDLVADLRGPPSLPVRFELVGRTDSIKGGIRNTFDVAPDLPVSEFVLRLQGGKKGLLVNSTNICRRDFRARVLFNAHNGKRSVLRPKLRASGCAKKSGSR